MVSLVSYFITSPPVVHRGNETSKQTNLTTDDFIVPFIALLGLSLSILQNTVKLWETPAGLQKPSKKFLPLSF